MARTPKATPRQRTKVRKVMREAKKGRLHSGSKKGPLVRPGSAQAKAIALSEAGLSRPKRKKAKR